MSGSVRPAGLLEIDFAEPEALQHSRDRTARVFGSDLEDAILQRGLLELTLRFFANFAFEVGVRRREKAGVTRKYSRFRIVDSCAQDFSRRQVNHCLLPL